MRDVQRQQARAAALSSAVGDCASRSRPSATCGGHCRFRHASLVLNHLKQSAVLRGDRVELAREDLEGLKAMLDRAARVACIALERAGGRPADLDRRLRR